MGRNRYETFPVKKSQEENRKRNRWIHINESDTRTGDAYEL